MERHYKTFEAWWEANKFNMADADTNIEIAGKAWRDGYDAGINKALDLQNKVNVKKLAEAFGGL
jgi:hypothetical protein